MHKFLASTLITIYSFALSASLFDIQPRCCSKEIHVGEYFEVESRLQLPRDRDPNFQWTEENRWNLIGYPSDAIEYISTSSFCVDAYGGDLFQWWTFKALDTGSYEIIFQHFDEQMTVTIQQFPL